SYTLLQGYDSLYLYTNKNVVCQFGGADQWGNITTGLEMIRKVVGSENKACCFSVPLLLKPDGTKFGKSESGSIYLDPEMTAPFEMYQFFFNQPDSQVEELLKKFTFLKKDEIIEICEKHVKEPSARIAQKALAQQVITDIHGENEYQKCLKISNALYTNSLHDLATNELYSALSGTRKFNAEKNSYSIIELLVEAGICKSKSDARTLIEQKAIFVNNDLVTDINATVSQSNSIEGKFSYIRKGKKDYTLIDFKK
ncbi:MAG: tyrosine--tRNA ligase, partial [Mycoplasmataceae bacterium]|nr:tyrosine--tRNA ligase [Mycoplasmataceae bacterium]